MNYIDGNIQHEIPIVITVFADKHLYQIDEILPDPLNLHYYDPEQGLPSNLDEADALLVRTVTEVNEQTLSPVPTNLRFVGTGSAGIDHIDTDFLQRHGIRAANSAGCNARSVAEYVVTALLLWSQKEKVNLKNECIGIAGVGHVGSELKKLLDDLQWPCRCYDPPRAERDPGFSTVTRNELLECSILTFHTPLTFDGTYATHHLLDADLLSTNAFKLVINSARGGVVDEQAVLEAKSAGRLHDLVIDVWEEEPCFH
ncbi:MAG: NAD(P)-dependent oxidoreductase, partial [Balneolaceae bacterium]|nr:NAD(P)-dependent oxidoreductase [Balneolaceae bacterium]